MKPFTLILLAFFCFSTFVFAQKPQPNLTPTPSNEKNEDKEIIRISSNLILVDALVLDKDGKQVTNLNAEEFEVLQDGKPQKIINFGYIRPSNSAVQMTETSKNKI
ncbi:MAG: hypothetical protein ABJA66_01735 [Actinomycetota bacterium]